MKRKMLCLLAALMVCAVFPAAAEEPQPVTAAELDAMLENVRTQALSSELLNDPTGEEAQSEDGTLFQYDFSRLYAAATTLAEDTPLNAAVYEDKPLGIDALVRVEDVAADVFRDRDRPLALEHDPVVWNLEELRFRSVDAVERRNPLHPAALRRPLDRPRRRAASYMHERDIVRSAVFYTESFVQRCL